MNARYLQDNTLFLRPVEPEDLELLYTIENNPDIWDKGTVTIPYSHYALRRFIQETQNDLFIDRQLRLIIVLSETGKSIGIVDLFNFEPSHLRAEIGIALLAGYQKKGLAAKAVNLLCEYAGKALRLHSLSAWVAGTNTASRHLFEHTGFEMKGCLEDWLATSSGFENVIIYQKIVE